MSLDANIITRMVIAGMGEETRTLSDECLDLLVNDIRSLVKGGLVPTEVDPTVQAAVERYHSLAAISNAALVVVILALGMAGMAFAWNRIHTGHQARPVIERVIVIFLVACATIAIFTTIGIVLSVLFESIRFFGKVPITDFLFGLGWSPQTAIRADQVGSEGAFGAVPLFAGTMLISLIAMLVAVPIGLLSAIFLAEYAGPRLRASAKPALEVLAAFLPLSMASLPPSLWPPLCVIPAVYWVLMLLRRVHWPQVW